MTDDDLRVPTGKSDLTLAQLGSVLPGTARLMAEAGPRFGACWHAAHAGNWDLAGYMLRTGIKLLRAVTIVRPRYLEAMTAFVDRDCRGVLTAIDAADPDAFDTAFDAMVAAANRYHVEFGKAFLVWKVPEDPPPDLDLTPPGS